MIVALHEGFADRQFTAPGFINEVVNAEVIFPKKRRSKIPQFAVSDFGLISLAATIRTGTLGMSRKISAECIQAPRLMHLL